MHGSSYFIRESITADTEFAMCDANANYNSMSSSSESAWLEDEPLVEDSTMSWHMLYFYGCKIFVCVCETSHMYGQIYVYRQFFFVYGYLVFLCLNNICTCLKNNAHVMPSGACCTRINSLFGPSAI